MKYNNNNNISCDFLVIEINTIIKFYHFEANKGNFIIIMNRGYIIWQYRYV